MKIIQCFVSSIILSLFIICTVSAQEPKHLVPFQANLTDANNNPIPSAVYNIRFQLYNAPTGGMAVWSEIHPHVSVVHGEMNILLGHMNPFPTDFNFTANRYLGIKINSNVEMLPRFQLIPSFHAYSALHANLAEQASSADSAVTASLATSAGSSTTAGHAARAATATNAATAQQTSNTKKLAGHLPDFYVLNTDLNALSNRIDALEGKYVPAGTVLAHSAETVPFGYFECNGQELSKSEHSELYAAIGGRYGETASNFRLPDYRGQFLRGWNDGKDDGTAPNAKDRTDSALGASGGITGDHVGTRQDDGIAPHQHTFTTGIQSHNHRHSEQGIFSTRLIDYDSSSGSSSVWIQEHHKSTGGISHSHTHSGTTDSNNTLETRPINITVMYIIKF